MKILHLHCNHVIPNARGDRQNVSCLAYLIKQKSGMDFSSEGSYVIYVLCKGCYYSLDWTTGLDYWTDLSPKKMISVLRADELLPYALHVLQ
jgi:hypothetical protein